MSCMQQEILSKYKQIFKEDTLAVIADRTGIQKTRVFRIFNGHEMKITEYERLKSIIETHLTHESSFNDRFIQIAKTGQIHLSESRLNHLTQQMINALKLQNITVG